MIKTVTYFEYQALKVIGKKITVLRANDNTATIVIGKQTEIKHQSINKQQTAINHFQPNKQFSKQSSTTSAVESISWQCWKSSKKLFKRLNQI